MHTVIEDLCTGCELCIPACPVDCISLVPAHAAVPPPTGWDAWSGEQAKQARGRYEFHQLRVAQAQRDNDARLQAKAERKLANLAEASRLTEPAQLDQKRTAIEAALARARARRSHPDT
jgi:electron transport complex protein RnfB